MGRSARSIRHVGEKEISEIGLETGNPGYTGSWSSCRREFGTKSPEASSATDQMRLGIVEFGPRHASSCPHTL
jgi:hypothetical protein